MKSVENASFSEAVSRGLAWVVAQQRDDGSFCESDDGIGAYYKVPYLLALAGCSREAHGLLSWVADHHFTPSGDFRSPERKAREPIHDAWTVYANAWIVQGAHRMGRWDLSLQGTKFILEHQTPIGGFYVLDGETRYHEPVNTSWGGLAALTTGETAAACRAGDMLVALVEKQPDPQRFYFRMDMQGDLITDVPEGQELTHYVDSTRVKQIYFNPGIALMFLCHLYRAMGKNEYLSAAKQLLSFAEGCAEDVYRFPPSGKLGMGCALLHDLTGSPDARRAALQVGQYLVETQTSDGSWLLPDEEPYSSLKDKDSFDIVLDVTAEFTTFLAGIAALI